ncbi:AfsR/SARP family transcriptional regulator [Streptomyces canus]|uniref:AfsR/SARP family transcriptional regulator n=1 Tax=Streptomyces canus TaxID=58343 RepID=UPI002259E93A|nr:AfsR/SARP family transcriptional regulator [Streptomyces canus]MCX4856314.1 AfsR/SARP family transcriptional regulator [Streptomyces canus]WSW38218.1 AfsR/SARP family transcriptional regulator [Streptomyces canus]
MMRYRVLGPFSVTVDDEPRTPQAAKVRQVLALLLLCSDRVVRRDSIIEELWGDAPPPSAVTTTQTYIYQIRRLLHPSEGAPHEDRAVRTVHPGYGLSVDPGQLDSTEFEQCVDRGRALLDDGRAKEAASLLARARSMWTGPVLADVCQGPVLRRYAARLEEKHILARELSLAADMRLGRHRELVAELKSLIMANPYHEWLHAQLMIALQRSGRRAEALEAFRHARRLLSDQLGIEPSEHLQQIHQDILEEDSFTP